MMRTRNATAFRHPMAREDTACPLADRRELITDAAVGSTLWDYLGYLTVLRIGKLVYGIVISLVVGELAVGWLNPQREVFQKDLLVADPLLGYRMVPHYQGTMATMTTIPVPFTTNSWGMRDREYGERAQGGLRIYVLGDSVVFGLGVPLEATFVKRMEAVLQQRLGRPVEVVNGGVPAYGTLQEVGLFEQTVAEVKPDLVLLAVTVLNDASDNLKFAKPARVVSRRMPRFLRAGLAWLRQRSQLYLLTRRYKAADNAEQLMQVHAVSPAPRMERGLTLTEEALQRFARAAQRHQLPFTVLIVPAQKQVSPRLWSEALANYSLRAETYAFNQPNERLVAFAQRQGMMVLDLLPLFRSHAGEDLYHNEHWKPRGHALVAEEIADFLLRNALVPSASTAHAEMQ